MVNMLDNDRSSRSNRRGDSSGKASSRGEGNKVYVSNIDFSCTHQDLKDAFKEVGEVAFVEMLKDSNQRPKGCAIVRFKDNNIADEAIRIMNRYELKGRKLVVKDERDAPRDAKRDRKRGREDDPYDRNASSGILDKWGNTYGLSIQFLESLGIDGPLVDRVFVANLDYNVSEDNLKEVFSIAGKVIDIELVRGDDGKSKGFGFIEFDHPVEAVQAISMFHNQMLFDRPMSVQLTRKEKRRKETKLPSGLKSVGPGLGINGTPLKDVASTIETGNQSSLLGAMPSGTVSSGLALGMDMGGLTQGINPSLGAAMGGGLQGINPSLTGGLAGGMVGGLASNLGATGSSLGQGGMGLMDRPSGVPVGVGLNASSIQNPIRSLADSSSSNFSSFSGTPFTNQRNSIQISNNKRGSVWKVEYNGREMSRT